MLRRPHTVITTLYRSILKCTLCNNFDCARFLVLINVVVLHLLYIVERDIKELHTQKIDPSRGRFFVMTAYTFYTFEAHIAAKTLVEKLIMVSSFTHRKDTQYALRGENVSPSLLIPDWIIF